jgi:rhizosphere induced protein
VEQSYSLKIQNQSGAEQRVAVFQVNSLSPAFSLVWLAQKINDRYTYPFTWTTNWGLGWGDTSQPLDIGVIYQSRQSATVQPNTANGVNVLPITYSNENFSSGSAYYDNQLQLGVMQIDTDDTFTAQQSLDMSVAVYMDNKPILAEQGEPISHYVYNTNNMSYYLTVTDYQEGAVLPIYSSRLCRKISAISQPTQVQFPEGVSDLQYILDGNLNFTLTTL